jgi:hypothetical protein
MTPLGPERRGFWATRRGFAMGAEWVYCFSSRREGDSEELVTGGGETPKFNTRFW